MGCIWNRRDRGGSFEPCRRHEWKRDETLSVYKSNVPLKVLKVIYKAYPIVMIGLFAVSFVIKDKGK